MTDSLSKYYDDVDSYLSLCEFYNEEPEMKVSYYDIPYPNCYGEHSAKLINRRRLEGDGSQKSVEGIYSKNEADLGDRKRRI